MFKNRVKSLLWRSGMMALAFFLSLIVDGLASLEVSGQATILIGLVLGEISKYLNSKYG